jgi:hypothetical protein
LRKGIDAYSRVDARFIQRLVAEQKARRKGLLRKLLSRLT